MQTFVCRELRQGLDRWTATGDWELTGGRKHPKLLHKPTGKKVTLSSSASDRRALLNFRSDCRKVSKMVVV